MDERVYGAWNSGVCLDPVIDEATLTPLAHESSAAERGKVLRDGRPAGRCGSAPSNPSRQPHRG
jgi:hypothetical protein